MSTSSEVAALRRRVRARAALPPPAERRSLRVAGGLVLRDIAETAGVTVAAVSAWERGAREPTGAPRETYGQILAMLRQETAGRQAA